MRWIEEIDVSADRDAIVSEEGIIFTCHGLLGDPTEELLEAQDKLAHARRDITKLKSAVIVTSNTLDDVIGELEEASGTGMDNIYVRLAYEILFALREQLRSGEFGDGDTNV